MWTRGSRLISSWMRLAHSMVLPRVDPPAPQVTETKAGSSSLRELIDLKSAFSPAGVLGGKNSKEKRALSPWSISEIRIPGVKRV